MNVSAWAIFTALLFSVFASPLPVNAASPFERLSPSALTDMEFNGDLNAKITIGDLVTPSGFPIPVRLEHRMRDLGFGEARSDLILRPFVTFLAVEDGVVRWDSVSGEQFRFLIKNDREARVAESDTRIGANFLGQRCVKQSAWGVSMLRAPTGEWCIIRQAGFEFLYVRGALAGFAIPAGHRFIVEAKGRYVHSLTDEKGFSIAVEWQGEHPQKLVIGNGIAIEFECTQNRIEKIRFPGRRQVVISYNAADLLEKVQDGSKETAIEWREVVERQRGDNWYRLPFCLARVNDIAYHYTIRGTEVRMSSSRDGRVLERAILRLESGKLKLVKE